MADRQSIAFLGLGVMGLPMADTLITAGFDVRVWNRSIAKAEPLAGRAAISANLAAAVAGVDIVCLCLTDAKAIEQTLFSDGGIAAALPKGALIIDFSTVGMRAAKDFGARLAALGLDYIDAPVSGGPSAAAAGQLTIFCGGTDSALERAAPILAAVSGRWTHMGDSGAGQATKMCNQLIVSSTLAAIAEAVAVAQALDLKADRLADALAGGYADSRPLQIFAPRMVSQNFDPPLGGVSIMHKDVKAILGDVEGLPLDLGFFRGTEAFYDLAVKSGLGDVDLGALVRLAKPYRSA